MRDGAEICVIHYAEPAEDINPSQIIPLGKHIDLNLETSGQKSFLIDIDKDMQIGLFAQHTAEEFNIKLVESGKTTAIALDAERTWVAQHEHDDEVGSISIERDGDVDDKKLNAWLSKLLQEKGVDIFRMKGFLSVEGDSRRFVFQGVHMLFDGQPDRPWGDLKRQNQLVFIGRNLDEEGMRQGFEACLV